MMNERTPTTTTTTKKKHRHELYARISLRRLRERLIASIFCQQGPNGAERRYRCTLHTCSHRCSHTTSTACRNPGTNQANADSIHCALSLCYLHTNTALSLYYMHAEQPHIILCATSFRTRTHAIFQVIYKCKTPTANAVCHATPPLRAPPQRAPRT